MARRLSKRALFKDLGYEPHAGQLAVHLSKAPRRVLASGVRWGKTLCAAMEALAAALEPRERSIGWVVAPTYDLSERVFSQVVITAASHLRHRIVSLKEHEHRIVLRNMGGGLSEIRGKSADNPVSLLGEGLDFLIIDEASRLKPAIWESHLSQRLIDKKGWALLISTPRGKGWLYELWRRGQEQRDPAYESWNAPSWTNPRLDRELIEGERARLPERVFRQEFGAEFLEGSGSVFRYVREAATGSFQEPEGDQYYVAGLALAKVEAVAVSVVMNRKGEAVCVDRFHRLDWGLQVKRISAACERFNNASVLVDTTGAGEPIYEALRAAGCYVDPYPFTQRSKNSLINNLSLLLERRKLVIPRPELWPEGIEELEAFEYSVTEAGSVRTSAPSGIHDDCVIGLALAAWQFKNDPGPSRFIVLPNPWERRKERFQRR
ncbi:MAG: hypothetical protein IPJ77_24400 [Planctomycetes bacterium]|nr:hypothetical protein [Planctomycetota bacterium]